jgi:alkaline phosphatase D
MTYVVLSGDAGSVHHAENQRTQAVCVTASLRWAAEEHERFDHPSSVVATELVATSISSGGDGADSRDDIAAVLAENPHIRYFNNRRA